jgi:hypothetical protein
VDQAETYARADAGVSTIISYFEVLVLRSKGHVVVGLAEAHIDVDDRSIEHDGLAKPLSSSRIRWLSQPANVAIGESSTGLLPDGVGMQAPEAALGLLAPGEVIGCGGVWKTDEFGQRQSLEIFFLRDGLLVASAAGPHLAAGEL